MNISNLRDQSNYETKQEGANERSKIVPKPANLTTSSWSRLKDPRIVRVSRAFGGKDRHSKVCTVRGLRDRRVRLSVPTAIQLYDLQDRLGLNQPSKVVDWLLEAAKNEIDELPPLQIPPGSSLGQNLQATINVSSQGAKTSATGLNWEDYWNPNKSKVIERETSGSYENNDHEDATHARNKQDHGTFVQPSNFFEKNPNSSHLPSLLNNVVPNSSFLKWDPSNLSLSRFGSFGSVVTPHQHDDSVHTFNMPSGSQILMYPPPPTQTQSYLPSHTHNPDEFVPKQLDFQMASSSSSSSTFTPPLYSINQGMRPFHLSMNPKFFSTQDNGGHEPRK